eukprot:1181242-Pyramimonas_sp.AAC.1
MGDSDVTLDMLPQRRLYPGFWQSPTLAENLAAAALGRAPAGSGLDTLLAAALPAARAALSPAPGQRPRPQRAASCTACAVVYGSSAACSGATSSNEVRWPLEGPSRLD